MIRFSDMSEFHQGYQFFMLRPSRAVSAFIIAVACIVLAAITWSLIAKMDDVVKATALLRPASTISHILVLSGGELLEKNYVNDDFVSEGDLLLRFDTSSDILDLDNSLKLMERVKGEIMITENLLETIENNYNSVTPRNGEVYIRSQAYIIEHDKLNGEINELVIRYNREKTLPETMLAGQRIEDIEREIIQVRLSFNLWRNNRLIETMNNLKTLSREQEIIERRISDLERNIKNATVRAPITGKVSEIRALNPGDYVLPGEKIMSIIPVDSSTLKAELYVNPAYVARIKTGHKVSLRFPGLPPSKFGKLEAEISIIPADFVIGQDGSPVFIVEAEIAEPYLVSRDGGKILLRAGIGAEGRVIIAQDRIMNMILSKLDFISTSMDLLDD